VELKREDEVMTIIWKIEAQDSA